jgi:hypothetical protein
MRVVDLSLRDLAPWVQRLSRLERWAIADLLSRIAARQQAEEPGGAACYTGPPPGTGPGGRSVEAAPLRA